MSDDPKKTGHADRDRSSLEQDDKVHDWCETLGVSEEQLRAAVQSWSATWPQMSELLKR